MKSLTILLLFLLISFGVKSQTYYEGYFKDKLVEIDSTYQDEEIFTDVDSYESENDYEEWGEKNDSIDITIYVNWTYQPYYRYNNPWYWNHYPWYWNHYPWYYSHGYGYSYYTHGYYNYYPRYNYYPYYNYRPYYRYDNRQYSYNNTRRVVRQTPVRTRRTVTSPNTTTRRTRVSATPVTRTRVNNNSNIRRQNTRVRRPTTTTRRSTQVRRNTTQRPTQVRRNTTQRPTQVRRTTPIRRVNNNSAIKRTNTRTVKKTRKNQ